MDLVGCRYSGVRAGEDSGFDGNPGAKWLRLVSSAHVLQCSCMNTEALCSKLYIHYYSWAMEGEAGNSGGWVKDG